MNIVKRFFPKCSLVKSNPLFRLSHTANAKLIPIGTLEDAKPESIEAYFPGQIFLHKLFGYRGIVLTSWYSPLIDKNNMIKQKEEQTHNSIRYYLTIIDSRSITYTGVMKDGVSFISEYNTVENFETVYGMDHVSHDDIIPISPLSHDRPPIVNDYFSIFFDDCADFSSGFKISSSFKEWFRPKRNALSVTKVYRETTNHIRITVIPFYLGTIKLKPDETNPARYWRYLMLIENITGEPVWLRKRTLKFHTVSGHMESTKGDGVVGLQPLLDHRNPVFQFSSHWRMNAAKGHGWGSLTFFPENASPWEAKIPSFSLDCGKSADAISSKFSIK